MQINIDLVPYKIERFSPKHFYIKDFPFDVRVPERWQNRQGGEYCGLGKFQIFQIEDGCLDIYAPHPMSDEKFLDEFCELIDEHYDALKEIGWEALNQC